MVRSGPTNKTNNISDGTSRIIRDATDQQVTTCAQKRNTAESALSVKRHLATQRRAGGEFLFFLPPPAPNTNVEGEFGLPAWPQVVDPNIGTGDGEGHRVPRNENESQRDA